MYVAPLDNWSHSHSDDMSTNSNVPKSEQPTSPKDIGLPSTNTSQNSITNTKRDKPAEKRCVAIHMSVQKKVDFGFAVWICGSTDFLGKWTKEMALRMQWTEGDVWTVTITEKDDPFPEEFEYKYMVRPDTDTIDGSWEPGDNRKLAVEKNSWNNEMTPFFIMHVKDTWESRDKKEITREGFMQEKVGETIQEYKMNHLPNMPICAK